MRKLKNRLNSPQMNTRRWALTWVASFVIMVLGAHIGMNLFTQAVKAADAAAKTAGGAAKTAASAASDLGEGPFAKAIKAGRRPPDSLVQFLDEYVPYLDIPGSPVHEDPFHPITRAGKELVANTPEEQVPIAWWHRKDRYAEEPMNRR